MNINTVSSLKNTKFYPYWLDNKDIELYKFGLTDVKALKKVIGDADYVYHIAGVVKAHTPEGFVQGNINMTKNVLEACLGAKNLKRVLITREARAVFQKRSEPGCKNGQHPE